MFHNHFSSISAAFCRRPVGFTNGMNQTELPDSPKLRNSDGPARLLPICASEDEFSRIWPLLQATGLCDPDHVAGSVKRPVILSPQDSPSRTELTQWVDASPDIHLLVFVSVPILDVARRIAEDCVPQRALDQWLQEVGSLLRLVRSTRRRSSLFLLEPALTNPKAFGEILGKRFRLEINLPETEDLTPGMPDAVLRMLAENALWQSAEARMLAAEIEATALPMPVADDFLLPAADQVFAEYQSKIDTPAQMARELREENDLLLKQLQRVHEKMEAFSADKRELDQHLSSAEQYTADLEKTLRRLEAMRHRAGTADDLSEENELLLAQLHKVQEELESQFQRSDSLSRELEQARGEIDALNETVATQASKSSDLEEENELLLLQVHQVQEEMESIFSRYEGANHEIEHFRSELAHAGEDLQSAHNTIEALYNSKSWKITRPLRAILGLLGAGRN